MSLSSAYVISANSHTAELFRQTAQSLISGAGVASQQQSLVVSQNGTPNMSINVNPGMVWVPGTLGSTTGLALNTTAQTAYGLPSAHTSQGMYCAYNNSTVNLAVAAADPTNPRIDLVCASVQDAQYVGSTNTPVIQVITGTAAPSPSAPGAPASSVVLAQIAVAAGATSITNGNITDKRPIYALSGGIPKASGFSQYPGNPVTGDYVDDASIGGLSRFNGSVWQSIDFGAWTAYTPTLTGSATNPTLGTGSSVGGAYTQIGKTVIGWAKINWGTSGTAIGSGQYLVSLPVPPATHFAFEDPMGIGRLKCAGLYTYAQLAFSAGSNAYLAYTSAAVNGSLPLAGSTSPGSWTANDQIVYNFAYDAA